MSIDYTALSDRIAARYGHLLEFKKESNRNVLIDLIETLEDFDRLRPALSGIVDCSFNDREFKDAIGKIRAWSWHTANHMSRLFEALMND